MGPGLVSGEAFSDGSVKWPRWRCLASGGLAIVQLDETGAPIRWHAAALCTNRHVAVHTEMLAMAVVAVNALEDGESDLWVDCQAVVSGFANLELVADGRRNPYAGILRVVRSALEGNGCRIRVRKIKTHRDKADVAGRRGLDWVARK